MNLKVAAFISFALAVLIPVSLVVGWYIFGTFTAAGTPSDPYIWLRVRNFATLAALVSLAHVVVLGFPAFLFLYQFNAIRWHSCAAAGFALGSIPFGFFAWPLGYPQGASAWHRAGGKLIVTMVNGAPTAAGWCEWAQGVAFMGLLGVAGGLSFWLVWRLANPHSPSKPMLFRKTV